MREQGRTFTGTWFGAGLGLLALAVCGSLALAGAGWASAPTAQSGQEPQKAVTAQPVDNERGDFGFQEYSNARIVRLSFVEGDVQVLRPEEEGWQQAVANFPIQQGYAVSTGQGGRAEIEFENGSMAWLAESSLLEFTELSLMDGARITRLYLSRGTASFQTDLDKKEVFTVQTPRVTASARDSARFRLDVTQEGSFVAVQKGDVSVDSEGGTHRVKKDWMLFFNNEDTQASESRRPREDAWDQWTGDRVSSLNQSRQVSYSYLGSSNCYYGAGNLHQYGSWYSLSGYGNVWRPFGVSLGWTPFFDGRWIYVRGYGWSWVSYEPWGWLPYHYGAWSWAPAYGWVWVPSGCGSWQPGFVDWYRYDNRIGWCPREPHGKQRHFNSRYQRPEIIVKEGIGANSRYRRIRLAESDKRELLTKTPRRITGFGDADDFEKNVRQTAERRGLPKGIEPPAKPLTGERRVFDAQGGDKRGKPPEGIAYDGDQRRYVNAEPKTRPTGPPAREPEGKPVDRSTGPSPRGAAKPPTAPPPSGASPRSGPPRTFDPPTRPSPPPPSKPASEAAPRSGPSSSPPSSPPPRSDPPRSEPPRASPPASAPSSPPPSPPPPAPKTSPPGRGGG